MSQSIASSFLTTPIRSLCFVAVGAAALACFAANSQPLFAQELSYTLEASENESVVMSPTMHNEMMAAWTTPTTLEMKRNRPYLLLTNTSATGDMTSFTLNIGTPDGLHAGQDPQTFDWARIVPAGTSAGVTTTSILPDTLDQNAKGDSVVINFGGAGLAPGQSVLFQVDIDPKNATSSPFADYRQVFFTISTTLLPDTDGNATTSASFTVPGGSQSVTLPDEVWANQVDGRHTNYGTAVAAHYMDDFVTQWATGGVSTVPEPSTIILAGLGALGAVVSSRRVRGNKNAV
ncbi:MAG TPA: PEP-CTERM sorting domain-containing protein [Pirellulales bacterium]|jgi:hypothetical protein